MEIKNPQWLDAAQPLDMRDMPDLGRVMVIAPHQDDESLGCGGTIALLRQAGVPVHVVFTTDGSYSHPNSVKYPAQELMLLREEEALKALSVLGVPAQEVTFLRLHDGHLPHTGRKGFDHAANLIAGTLAALKPETLLIPWQRDPHPDHRATWQMVQEAVRRSGKRYRVLEYFVWLWERAAAADLPLPGEVLVWMVDTTPVKTQKQQAIAAHASQTTGLIDDDPQGFTLWPEMLAHFNTGEEILAELIATGTTAEPTETPQKNKLEDMLPREGIGSSY